MTRNFKALGLGLVAALAVSAVFALGASADPNQHTGGEFTNDAPDGHVLLDGSFAGEHQMHLSMFGSAVGCIDRFDGTLVASTVTSMALFLEGTVCGSKPTIHMNGCTYTFTVRDTDASTEKNPVHLICPGQEKGEIVQHGSCTVTFGSQTFTEDAFYKAITVNDKHAVTVEFVLNTAYEKHGACVFMPPVGTGPHSGANGISLTGSVTLTAWDTDGNPVNFTAKGSNGH